VAGGKLESDTGFSPRRTVADGVAELVEAFRQAAITLDELEGPRCVRLRRVQQLIGEGVVDEDLRRRQAA
jgi:hypothetical protein